MTRLLSFTPAEYPAMTPEPNVLITPCKMILPTEMKLCCKTLGIAIRKIRCKILPEKTGAFSAPSTLDSRRKTTVTASTQLTHWHRNVAHATPATPI